MCLCLPSMGMLILYPQQYINLRRCRLCSVGRAESLNFFLWGLWLEPRTLCIPGDHSTRSATSSAEQCGSISSQAYGTKDTCCLDQHCSWSGGSQYTSHFYFLELTKGLHILWPPGSQSRRERCENPLLQSVHFSMEMHTTVQFREQVHILPMDTE